MKKVLIMMMCLALFACNSTASDQNNEENLAQVEETSQEQVEETTEDLDTQAYAIDLEEVSSDNAIEIIRALSDEKYGGRQAGTLANEAAEDYLVDLFKEAGLKPIDSLNGYKQDYTQMVALPVKSTQVSIEGKDITFEYQKDFTERFRIGYIYYDTETQAEMIYITSKFELSEDKERFHNKVILMPQDVYYDYDTFTSLELLTKEGINVEAVITSTEAPEAGMRVARGVRGNGYSEFEEEDPVLLIFTQEKFDTLVALSEENAVINISMDYEVKEETVANIVGYIPGKHEEGEDETIILGAHFDHVGDNMDGTFNAGALDNASGVSVILEIAKMIANGEQPEDDVIVIAFNGEEDGLIGSEYFTKNPPIEYKTTNTKMLNLDMVGSSNPVPLYIGTSSSYSTSMKDELADLAEQLDIDYEKESMGSSDHVNFSEAGIKSVMLIHLDFAYYHTALDTLENAIDANRLEDVMRLCLAFTNKEIYE